MTEPPVRFLDLVPRHAAGICLAGLLLALLPDAWLAGLGIQEWRGAYRPWIVVLTIVSGCVVLCSLAFDFTGAPRRTVGGLVQRLTAKAGASGHAPIIANFRALADDERLVLTYMLLHGQQMIRCPVTNGTVHALCRKGLMVKSEGQGSMVDWPHTIPKDVWDELQLRRAKLLPQAATSDPGFAADVEYRIRQLFKI